MKHGNRNTKFFHEQAKQRGQRNFITSVLNNADVWCTSQADIEAAFCHYFQELFQSSRQGDLTEKLDAVQPVVTSEHNLILSRSFTRVEVKAQASLLNMYPTKSLRVDGMDALFYHKHWDVVGDDVVSFCLLC